MIIFLYGQDTYRSRSKLNEIIGHYKKIHKSGLNLKFFDGREKGFEEFKDDFQQTSMFGEKKLLILTNIFDNSDFKEKLLKTFKSFLNSRDIILFYESGLPKKDDKFFNLLKKQAKAQEFKNLEGEKLYEWVKKEFEKLKIKITPSALTKLISFVGQDSWQLNNEIKKLANFKLGKTIEVKDIDLLIKPKVETDVFKTIDAIAVQNKKMAISLIHEHLAKGDSPLYLFSMINFQFRNLLIIKDLIEKNRPYYVILKQSRLHPFVVKKSWQQAKKFTLNQLKKIYQKIFQVDLKIKTGKLSPQAALDLLLAEI